MIFHCVFRYSGHSMSDPGSSYRTRDEVQQMRETRDPILIFKSKLLNSNLITSDEIKVSNTFQLRSNFKF